jgi:hypothetical protein
MSSEQDFHDPIELPDGRVLRTLRYAGQFIQELPKAAHDRPEWQAAIQALLLVVECDGDTARLHRHHACPKCWQDARAGITVQARQETPHLPYHSVTRRWHPSRCAGPPG